MKKKNNMEEILVIIPLHEFNQSVSTLLTRAINSVPREMKVLISTTQTVYNNNLDELTALIHNLQEERSGEIIISNNNDQSDFCSLVNSGVKLASEWFTILEFDDEFSPILFNNLTKEMSYKNDVSVFLSLNEIIDYNTNQFVSYGNEAPWASSFSNEIGYIDNDCLQEYFNFFLTGGIFNVQDWLSIGGLKPSIKVSFWYEFLLRLTSNDKKVYVIPKVGYKHYINRENSLYDTYKKSIPQEDVKKWYDLAKREYQFKEDRQETIK